jgi:uncharacterized membrane protein YdjX (TVP38/TMEM64 family)
MAGKVKRTAAAVIGRSAPAQTPVAKRAPAKSTAPTQQVSTRQDIVSNPIWVPVAGLIGLIALGFAWLLLPLDEWLKQFSDWINSYGAAGVIGFAVFFAVALLLLMPGAPMTIAAAIAYGWWAVPLALGAGLVSATVAFLISRYLLRKRIEPYFEQRPKLRAVEAAVNDEGWKVVALVRLSPVIPFATQNYFFGVTGVPFRTYLIVSAFAVLPGTFLDVYIGILARTASQDGGPVKWTLLIVGLIATVAVMILVTVKARAKLREHGVKA